MKNEAELKEGDERPESGGIVTTVKAELPTRDPDFQAALVRKYREAGLNDDGTDPNAVAKPVESAVKPAKSAAGGDWQAALTPEQKAEVDKLYRERRASTRAVRDLEAKVGDLEKKVGQPAAAAAAIPQLQRPTRPDPAPRSRAGADLLGTPLGRRWRRRGPWAGSPPPDRRG